MAPENFRSEKYTGKVDVYSFSIIVWETLSAKRAFTNLYFTAEQIADGMATRGLRPTVPPAWPAPVANLIKRMWADDPHARPHFSVIAPEVQAWASLAKRNPKAFASIGLRLLPATPGVHPIDSTGGSFASTATTGASADTLPVSSAATGTANAKGFGPRHSARLCIIS